MSEGVGNGEMTGKENSFDPWTSTFLLAGPVKLHPRIQQAMAVPSLNHRGEYFHSLVGEIKEMLPLVFGTKGHQAVVTGSGTAGLEAMISGLVGKDDRVVVLTNGHFGNRLVQLATIFGKPVIVKAPWGKPFEADAIESALAGGKTKALLCVYNETSIGLTNDAARIGAMARKHEALFLLDAISALPGLPTPEPSWGVDGMVVGSQKGLGAPPGLALVHVSDRAFISLKPQTFANDLAAHLKSIDKDDTPWTPAVPLFLALKEALTVLKEEGVAIRQQRTKMLANSTRRAVKAMGLPLFCDENYASDTVTGIRYPQGVDDGQFRAALRERHNVIVSGGQGEAKGSIFRIGHMGIASPSDVLAGIAAIEKEMHRLGKVRELGPGVTSFLKDLP